MLSTRMLLKVGKVVGFGPVMSRATDQLERLGDWNAAHDYALQRGAVLRRIRFADGRARWVAFDERDRPLAAFPRFGRGEREALVEAIADVRLDRVPVVRPRPGGVDRYLPRHP